MSVSPRISDAEWEVMRALWSQSPLTANEVVNELSHHSWKPNTVKTLLSRLVKKGAVSYDQQDRVYYYSPSVDQHECIRTESRTFLDRVYGGALRPLLVNFIQSESLTAEDVAELKRMLDEKERTSCIPRD